MKHLILTLALLTCSLVAVAQKGISYQAVILDPKPIKIPGQDITGQPFVNGDVSLKFKIYSSTFVQEFEEVHVTKTDGYGLVNVLIGSVSPAAFASLVWDSNAKNLQVWVSFDNGGNYTKVSEQVLTYNPYAIYAETAGKLSGTLGIAAGGTGATTAVAARTSLGLGNVDNTADVNKPISTATQAALDTKANADEVNTALATKANANEVTTALATKANAAEVATVLATKANASDVSTSLATKANANEVTTALATKANVDEVTIALATKASAAEVATALANKANASDVTATLALKEDVSNKANTPLGSSTTFYPTQNAVKTYVDAQVAAATIADASSSTKGKIQLAGDLAGTAAAPTVPGLALKANASEVTTALAVKADTTYVLTKVAAATIADASSSTKGKIQLAGDLAGTAAAPTVPGLALKANAADVTSALATKASSSDLTSGLALKANTSDMTAALALKSPLASPSFTGTVAIGTTNPSPSAVLDVTSTSKGLLLPRLTFAQKSAIVSPEPGLIFWCTDCGTTGEMQVYNGTAYVNMIGSPAQLGMPAIGSTTGMSSITSSTASSGGVISSDGGAAITARGVVWGTSTNPTIALSTKTTDGTGTGTFTSSLTGLTSGLTYYVRSYATNSVGTKYGSEITFNSLQSAPTLAATTAASSIGATTATSGGTISYNGGATVTVSGLVWSTSATPTVALSTKTTNGTLTGTYTSAISGLTPGTLYYVRSYATNAVGTSYGAQTSFTTLTTPTLAATTAASSITSTTATSGGTITSNGGANITSSGVVYGTSPGSSTYSATSGTSVGTFVSNLTGLTPATTYYVRAFATNSVGTVYGTEISFTTLAVAPTLSTTAASSITKYAASSGGSITSNGGSVITASGICWSTTATPTTSDSNTTDGTTTGTFTSSITGLTAGTTYYVRAYATNGIGTSYGDVQSFTTLSTSSNNPVLASTTPATSITTTTAVLGGNVTDEGATEVSARGLVYGTSTGSSTFSVTLGAGAGTFTSTLTGLAQGTTYFVRSFATNVQGTSYGAETSFTTQTTPTVSATSTPTSVTTTTAVSGGTISSTGGASITTSGLVWDVNSNPEITLATKTTDGATSGTFTSSITGLTQGTTYHVRAYATNSVGTSYGPDVTFTTLTTPTVTATATVTSITGTTATSGGTITSDGGASITTSGLVWDVNSNPEITLATKTTDGAASGTFTSSITGLTRGTTYHIRAYATNSVGTSYGPEVSFATPSLPTLTTSAITINSITGTSAVLTSQITSDGGATAIGGFQYGIGSYTNTATSNSLSGGTFSTTLTGLIPGTVYQANAFATNTAGTVYGNTPLSFTTLNIPTLSSTTVTNISGTSAESGANITSDGGANIISRGLVWGTSSGSSTYSITVGSGTGPFNGTLTGLSGGNTYYVRAFATNSVGTSYGAEVSFSTQIPTVTSSTGRIWMDRNLGATRVVTSSDDVESFGYLYNWGRYTDGHQERNASVTSTKATSSSPNTNLFINGYDWLNPSDNNLWQGVNGINNPCPTGFRIPTESEWLAEMATWSSQNAAGAFASVLKLPRGNFRDYQRNDSVLLDDYTRYWSSTTVGGNQSKAIIFDAGYVGISTQYRGNGFSVRCIKD